MAKKYILDVETVKMKLQRMVLEIIENNLDERSIILVGIQENGSVIARFVEKQLKQESRLLVELINLSLDKKTPGKISLSSEPDFDKRVIILIDDVANTGKTMLYAIKPFLEFYPSCIQTLALVERTHKKFPVKLDYVGLSVATTLQEHIYVEVSGEEVVGVYLE